MPRSNVTASSSSSNSYSASRTALPFTQSLSDFEVERSLTHKSPNYAHPPTRNMLSRAGSDCDAAMVYQHNVSSLMSAKARPFSISGHIPLDSKSLTVFFRSAVCSFNPINSLSKTDVHCTTLERHHALIRLSY